MTRDIQADQSDFFTDSDVTLPARHHPLASHGVQSGAEQNNVVHREKSSPPFFGVLLM